MTRKISLALPFILVCTVLLAASNPVPLIYQPLSPTSVPPGNPAFTLTVHGTGFVSGAVIKSDGVALKTQFVSSTTLEAAVPASAVAHSGTATITVANPGSIDSNVIYFTVRKPSTTGTVKASPAAIENGFQAVGDFNNDHRPDIVVSSVDVDVYLNAGKGKFNKVGGPEFDQLVHYAPAVVADFNNDGNLDVAPCGGDGSGYSPSSCSILFGDGKGNLTYAPNGQYIFPGVMADINGDGILDNIAVWEAGGPDNLAIYLGKGDGTYTNVTMLPTNYAVGLPVVGDFNGDGKLDVAMPAGVGDKSMVAVFLGNGDGTFQNEVDYTIPHGGALAVADLNGDGKLDIVSGGFSVLMGNGDGTFTLGASLDLDDPAPIQVADVNGDGKLDLVTDTYVNSVSSLAILLGNGDGTFQHPITVATPGGGAISGVADFNGDGLLDFAIQASPQSSVLLQAPSK
jgi:uncharacterized protein (DUF2141 family)